MLHQTMAPYVVFDHTGEFFQVMINQFVLV